MDGASLLPLLLLYLALIGLPAAAAALVAARLGLARVPLLLGVALAASAASGMLAFWAYYEARSLGEAFSYALVFVAAGVVALLFYERRIPGELLRALATPFALWALGTAFILFLGFMHGGTDHPTAIASHRFTGQLPSDSEIPHFYAEWFFRSGHHGTPPIYPPDWLASDRPPLQIGYALAVRPFGWDGDGLHYQVLGVVLQQLWIIGLWALLLAAGLGRRTRGLAMVTVLVSNVVIVNGFYVWPKLLPAALLLAAAAVLLTPLWGELRRNLWAAALIAALFGLAMMGHGGSVFGIVPLAIIAAFRGLPSWRWLGVALLTGIVVMAPWSAYQKYADPPGNRLTKWMLAGVTEIDGRGVGESITDSYSDAGLGGAIHNKAENGVTMAGGGPMGHLLGIGWRQRTFSSAIEQLRVIGFLFLFPAFGLFLLAPFAMLLNRRRARGRGQEWRFALVCFALVAVAAITWGLMLFGNTPSRTVIHAGSLMVPVVGFAGAVAGLHAAYPRFAVWLVAVNAALMLLIYVPDLTPEPGSSVSALCLLLAGLGLAGFGWAALGPGDRRRDDAPLAEPGYA